MYPARGTFASTLPPSACPPRVSIEVHEGERRTHGDGLADLSLDLLGDVFLDKELDGHAIAVLEYRLHARPVSMQSGQGGKDGRTMAAMLAEASNLGRGLEFPLRLIRLGSWLPHVCFT